MVTEKTNPDWDPILKKAGGIITNQGGLKSISTNQCGITCKCGIMSLDLIHNYRIVWCRFKIGVCNQSDRAVVINMTKWLLC